MSSYRTISLVVFVGVVAFLAQTVPDLDFALIQSLSPLVHLGIVAIGALATAGIVYWQEHQATRQCKKQLEQMRRAHNEDYIRYTLQGFVTTRFKSTINARARVFVISPEHKLRLFFQYPKQNSHDGHLSFEKGRGWVGQAWDAGDDVVADLAAHEPLEIQKQYSLNKLEYTMIKRQGVKSALCVPIPNDDNVVIGVIGVDSTAPLSESKLDEERIKRDVWDLALVVRGLLDFDGRIQNGQGA